MIQSMEILQLPIMALQDRIEQEMNENPLLELQEQDPTLPDEPTERENPDAPTDTERELVVDGSKDHVEDFERLTIMDIEAPGMFDDGPRRSLTRMEEEADRKHDAMSNVMARPESLNDYLMHQIGEMELQPGLAAMAERIISALDASDGGYLKSSLEDLLPPDSGPDQLERARRALEIVQSLDPPGIAARDLRECLLLQLTPDMPYCEELKTLISSHLEDLRDNRLPQIERRTGYTIDRIQKAWQQLRKLNPKPGAQFAGSLVPTVTPDVTVERADDGTYRVALEDTRTPRLFISDYYRRRLLSGDATAEEREFIKRKINAAQWLIDSIEQRRGTLTRVAQAIVDHQKQFLDDGPEFIVPLKMQQIADVVGVHVTTVSRAVDDKWIQTPRGMFPLKRLFAGGTHSDDGGDDVAWDTIRIRLQELVDKEDKTAPISDDALVGELEKQGMKVARRTVTKYRRIMGIPSSRQRRDWSKRP
jgi:RNA polymerase sigma-54 factor